MAQVQTYTSAGNQLSAENKTFYDRVLLERLLPKLVFMKYGQKKSIPKREGSTVNFRRFNSLSPATTPLAEGVTPSGSNLSITEVTATVQQYGDYVTISDWVDMTGIDPVLTETIELLGEQAGETLDEIVRDVVAAGTNVLYSDGASRADVNSNITATLIKKARRFMKRNNVKPVTGNEYIGIIHPDVAYDIMGLSEWTNANQYAGSQKIFDGEIGKLYGVRFIETSKAPIFEGEGANGKDVYGTIVLGKGGYGIPDIAGSSKPETIVKQKGSAGTGDPLNQRATAGWKAALTAVRLQELAILRIETTATV